MRSVYSGCALINNRLAVMPYPWQICEEERFLTEEKIAKLLRKYIQILSDSVLEIEYQSVENGG